MIAEMKYKVPTEIWLVVKAILAVDDDENENENRRLEWNNENVNKVVSDDWHGR